MGVFITFITALCMTSKDVVSKQVSTSVHPTVSTFASFVYTLPLYSTLIAFLYFARSESLAVDKMFFLLVIARASTDVVGEWGKMYALSRVRLSVIAPLYACTPVWVALLTPFVTGEALSTLGIVGILLVVGGNLSILKYERLTKVDGDNARVGVFVAIASSLFLACNTCFDALAVRHASAPLSAATMTGLAAFLVLPFASTVKGCRKQLTSSFQPFALRALMEVGFMVGKLFALQYLAAPYVAGLLKGSLLFSMLAGKFVFHEDVGLRKSMGGLVIFIGAVSIILSLY
jgi:drug/metabolite transporter (DMT)-like permease